jgi:Predicted membrane protein
VGHCRRLSTCRKETGSATFTALDPQRRGRVDRRHAGTGISVSDPIAALIAAAAIGLANATIGFVLKILTFPLTVLTLGLFWFVINAMMLELAAAFVRGFYVRNFVAAFIGAIVLSIVSSLLQWLVIPRRKVK